MKIVLVGRSGQLGWELERALQPLGRVIALDRAALDLSRPETVGPAIASLGPDVIVNASAYTAVDDAEMHPALATAVNATAVGELAAAANRHNALLVHYSTDYVFDGKGDRPYRETDRPDPQTVYGQSKLAGERLVAELGTAALVFRTSWVYGTRGRNFLRSILEAARRHDVLRVVADQHGTPTAVRALADLSAHALRIAVERWRSGDSSILGLYHLTLKGQTTWHAFAQAIVDAARVYMGDEIRSTRIEAISTAELQRAAPRPNYSVLDCNQFDAVFRLGRPAWEAALALVVADYFEALRQ